jgi:hypothetical protein
MPEKAVHTVGNAVLLCALCACNSSGTGSTGPGEMQHVPDGGAPGDSSVAADSSARVDSATPDSATATDSAGALDSNASMESGDANAVDAGPSVCNPATTWGPGTLLSISTDSPDRFGAITPDELTIAWMTPADADASTTGTVYYADRATVSDPFGTPSALSAAAAYFAFDRVALSPDGLTLVVVRADHQGFGAASRTSRPGTFGAPDETAFNGVDINHADMPDPGLVLANPVWEQDPTVLFFTEYASTTVNPIGWVDLVGGIWTDSHNVAAGALAASSGQLRRPTGLSADLRTLFFYDEVASIERAAWRDSADGDFSTFSDVGAFDGAEPNRACTRIYYSAQGASSVDLFYSDAQ